MGALGNLVVSLALDTADFTRSIDRSSHEAQKFAQNIEKSMNRAVQTATEGLKGFALGALGAVGAVTTVSAAISKLNDTFNQMDALSKNSQKFGIPVKELSALQYAADLSGVSIEKLGDGMKDLLKNSLDAASGQQSQAAAFKALGVSVVDTNGKLKSSTQLLLDSADAISQLKDGAAKTGIVMKIFGESGRELIPLLNSGASGIRQMTDEAERLGVTMDGDAAKAAENYNDNISRLKGGVNGLFIKMANELVPTLSNVTSQFLEGAKAADTFGDGVAAAMSKLLNDSVRNVSPAQRIKELQNTIGVTENYLDKTNGGIGFDWMIKAMGFSESGLKTKRAELALYQKQLDSLISSATAPPTSGAAAALIKKNDDEKQAALQKRIQDELDHAKKEAEAAAAKAKAESAAAKANAEAAKALQQRNQATIEFYADQQKQVDSEISVTNSVVEQIKQLQTQTDLLGATEEQTRNAELANMDFAMSELELKRRMADNGFANRDLIAQYDNHLAVLKELKAAKIAYYDKKTVVDAANAMKDTWKQIFSDVEQGLTNSLINGFDNGKTILQSFGDYLKGYFKTLVVRFSVQPIISGVAGALGISYGTTAAASDLSILKSAGSALGNFGSSFAGNPISAITNGFSMLNGSLTTGLQDLYINTAKLFNGGVAGYDTIYNAGQFSEIANGIGSAVGYLSAINAGLNGKYLTGIGTAAGTYLAGPIGGLIGNIAGGLLDKVFGFGGGGGPKVEGGYYGATGSGFTGGGQLNDATKQISLNTVNQYDAIVKQLGGVAQKLAIDTFIGTDPQGTAASSLAFNAYLNGQQVFNRQGAGRGYENIGRDQAALQAEVDQVATRTIIAALQKTKLADNLTALFSSVNVVSDSLDKLKTALDNANVLRYLNLNLATFSANVRNLSAVSLDSFNALVAAAGGTTQLTGALNQYMNVFATDSEKLASAQRTLNETFAALGVAVPSSTDELKKLIDAQDLTTASGRNTYLALINIAASFQQVQSGLDQMKAAIDQTRQHTLDYIDLLENGQKTALEQAAQQITDVTSTLYNTSDPLKRIAIEGQLTDLIMQRYQAEQDMLNAVMSSIQEGYAKIEAERTAVQAARQTITGQNDLVMSAAQIRAAINDATALGTFPSSAGLQAANDKVASLNAASQSQADLVATLSGQKSAAESAMQSAQATLSNTTAKELASAQAGISAASRLASQYGVWLNGNASGTGQPFTIKDGKVSTNWQSIGYYTNNPGSVTNFKNAFYDDTTLVGGRTAFDAIYGANARIAAAQKLFDGVAKDLANKTISLAQAQAKASNIQDQLAQAEIDRVAAQQDFTKQIQQYVLDAGKATDKLTSLREETVKYYQQQQALAQLMANSSNGIRSVIDDVRFSGMTAQQQLQDLQAKFNTAVASANTASGTNLAGFGDTVANLIQPLLQKAGEVYGVGGFDYKVLEGAVLQQADLVASRLDALAPKDYQQESLSLLDTIDTSLALIEENTSSAEALIVQAINDSKAATTNALRGVVAAIEGDSYDAYFSAGTTQKFANGGVFSNSIVTKPTFFNTGQMGEAGIEGILPLRNVNGRLGVSAADDGMKSLLIQMNRRLESLEQTVKAGDAAIAKNTGKVAKNIDRIMDADSIRVTTV
ncbi:MAG TPA: hypothetical protein VFX23_10915 [Limnobacter sp.]|uniref:hypothetical protein n=1 Tax=Limnobacter sp. TaxID=2003368 RepID=UPI002E324899|nr:hypothetical protein [Limnobacter sp.]HEX5486495.1 hypothetical protein [Limnobacter sp.]